MDLLDYEGDEPEAQVPERKHKRKKDKKEKKDKHKHKHKHRHREASERRDPQPADLQKPASSVLPKVKVAAGDDEAEEGSAENGHELPGLGSGEQCPAGSNAVTAEAGGVEADAAVHRPGSPSHSLERKRRRPADEAAAQPDTKRDRKDSSSRRQGDSHRHGRDRDSKHADAEQPSKPPQNGLQSHVSSAKEAHTGGNSRPEASDKRAREPHEPRDRERERHSSRERPHSKERPAATEPPPARREPIPSFEERQKLREASGVPRARSRDREPEAARLRASSRDTRPLSRDRSGLADRRRRSSSRDRKVSQQEDQEYRARVEAKLEAGEQDEDKLIEERRRRRQEILARARQQQALSESVAAPTATELRNASTTGPSPAKQPGSPLTSTGRADKLASPGQPPASPGQPAVSSQANGPARDMSMADLHDTAAAGDESPSISEADYQDMDTEHMWQSAAQRADADGAKVPDSAPVSPAPPKTEAGDADKEEGDAKGAAGGLDMFSDEAEADMFAATPEGAPGAAVPGRRALLDNYDDPEGYYQFQVGEIMDERYEVFATHGKGVFSTVVRARDRGHRDATGAFTEVAIKMIRANDTMYKAGQVEQKILRKLAGADVKKNSHCIQMLRSFEYRNHLCLVFEPLDINLRELTKKYGRGIGLNISAVAKYAAQMLVALHHMRNCGVLHADIKPDNILVSRSRTLVKICDFGSAMLAGENEITPYLVSRFYRAPEVILGLRYEHAMDMWSVGCVIYELFTGKILFPGRTNNEMLKLMMDVKGPFPKKMLKKGVFTDRHFENDPNMSFSLIEEDPMTKQPVRRLVSNPQVKRDFGALLAGSEGDRKKVAQLADLLERMMQLDPDKRISPKEALRHDFIKLPCPKI
ncbi:hypothetical protein WJX72_008716 [[Myrmecia] bisecta]|uniref:non-specific serine/threonine protein kinase n=1 Tax=[Myrmecia] bisecta TaxID=41462 RepID=A0AAW1Q3K3_9CHLO